MNTVFQSYGHPRTSLSHLPTPLEFLPRLSAHLGRKIWIKRDDCTGLALGGNKARQLEFYFGAALDAGADTILITGAVQSNYVRMAAAAAAKLGLKAIVQLEDRVPGRPALYNQQGNVLLSKLFGAEVVLFPEGENEAGADANLERMAGEVRAKGGKPYVIYLGAQHPPIGALGYVAAAEEFMVQARETGLSPHIFVGSGTGHTHAGLLVGLARQKKPAPVTGVCVRRSAEQQRERVQAHVKSVAALVDFDVDVASININIDDSALGPGYGQLMDETLDAINTMARLEGILLDPVYTAKVMAGLIRQVEGGLVAEGEDIVFWHTGGVPSLFGYRDVFV